MRTINRHIGCFVRTFIAAAFVAAMSSLAPAAEPVAPLVSVDWLKTRLGQANLVVLDVRSAADGGGKTAYETGHIRGAIHSDYMQGGWRVTRGGVPAMFPETAALEALIGGLGIDEEVHAVIVPEGTGSSDFGSAARIYWTLKVLGHERVSILDGGFAAWKADANNPIERGSRAPSPRIFTAKLNRALLADAGEVETVLGNRSATLLDGRPAAQFEGREKSGVVKAFGHIPGAINLDQDLAYDRAANRLKNRAELERIFAPVPAGPVVNYCNTGHWSSTTWFVLSEILGRKDVKLYPGSMAEWTTDPRRPVVSGRTRLDDLKARFGISN